MWKTEWHLASFIFLYLVPYRKGVIHFEKALITGLSRSSTDTIFLIQKKTHFWLVSMHSIYADLCLTLGFHVISDTSVEDLVPHTPGKFLLTCNLNSYASLYIFCCFLFCRGTDQLLSFSGSALFKYFKNITESQPWPGLQCGTHIQVARCTWQDFTA